MTGIHNSLLSFKRHSPTHWLVKRSCSPHNRTHTSHSEVPEGSSYLRPILFCVGSAVAPTAQGLPQHLSNCQSYQHPPLMVPPGRKSLGRGQPLAELQQLNKKSSGTLGKLPGKAVWKSRVPSHNQGEISRCWRDMCIGVRWLHIFAFWFSRDWEKRSGYKIPFCSFFIATVSEVTIVCEGA